MAHFFVVASLFVSILTNGVHALPWTNATCVRELWSLNSRQQSPCLVSAYLGSPCTHNNWGVEAIGTQGPYVLPVSLANSCLCNTVVWNLLSACSICQGGLAGNWNAWITNCPATEINIGKYPVPIPTGITVPHWAYYDFTNTGVFDVAIASLQSGPESTAEPFATATSTATSNSPEPTATQQSGSANNTGAIVGGAVGGVLGLAVIGLIAFVVVRNGKRSPEAAGQYPQDTQGGYNPPVGIHPGSAAPMMAQHQPQPGRPGMVPTPSTVSGSAYKHHDSSDLVAFQSGANISSPPTPLTGSLPYNNNPQHQARPGNYTGAPQV